LHEETKSDDVANSHCLEQRQELATQLPQPLKLKRLYGKRDILELLDANIPA
jgi:hypothetical protein